jgi:hypothetical protein
MIEIYAEFNDIAADGSLPLTCNGSVESIDAIGPALTHGEEVWLSDGELRVRGRVFRRDDGCWEARAKWDDLR